MEILVAFITCVKEDCLYNIVSGCVYCRFCQYGSVYIYVLFYFQDVQYNYDADKDLPK